MKTLHLLRHAKSSWKAAGVDDHDRDLNDRGRRDGTRMGSALSELFTPQAVHCSSALRARRTLELLCEGWPALADQEPTIDPALYTFDWREVLRWLQVLNTDADSVLVIGHNPALTDLCNQLVGRPTLDNLPTAGYLRFSLAIDRWSDAAEGTARLEGWQFPRDLS